MIRGFALYTIDQASNITITIEIPAIETADACDRHKGEDLLEICWGILEMGGLS